MSYSSPVLANSRNTELLVLPLLRWTHFVNCLGQGNLKPFSGFTSVFPHVMCLGINVTLLALGLDFTESS